MILTKYDAAFHIQCEKQESFAEGEEAGYQRGMERGCNQTRREMIRGLVANGVDREVICRSASITEEELETILQEISTD